MGRGILLNREPDIEASPTVATAKGSEPLTQTARSGEEINNGNRVHLIAAF
jgi:hypothetical protein